MEKERIKLQNVKTGKEKEFDAVHAKNILQYEKARRFNEWTLPKNSTHSIDKDGNLIKRGGLAIDKGAETSEGNPAGEGEKGEA